MLKFVLVVVIVAAVVYLLVRLVERRGTSGTGAVRRGPLGKRPPQGRAIAPDDDDAFLRDLNRRRRRSEEDPPQPA